MGRVAAGERPRLGWWLLLVGVLASLAYSSRATGGRPPEDALYQWGTALAAAVVYGVVLGLVLLIARGGPARQLLALRRPRSWPVAIGLCFALLILVLIVGAALDPFLEAGEEQGLAPSSWDADRAVPFAANAVVVVGLAPVIEELTYRGLGYSLLHRFGVLNAITAVGLAFGLAHGLVEGLPILAFFGMGLAALRHWTESVYPPILLHAAFNGFALTVSVTV